MPVTDREHLELVVRVHELEARVDDLEADRDRLGGMLLLLRFIFGASLVGAIAGMLGLLEIVQHMGS